MSKSTKKDALPGAPILEDIKSKPCVPIWPHYGYAHDVGRGKAYEMAKQAPPDEILVIGGGSRATLKALSGPLRRKLHIERE
jgi:hypothetical protein